jgi:GNAT superfamily N-acetyltransferase
MASFVDDSETQCGLVAEEDGRVVGMLGGYLTDYFFCDETVACDMALFVEKDYRLGTAAVRLIQAFRDWARARGAREVCLAVSTAVNIDVTGRFYEKMGFARVGAVYKQRLDSSGE